jgi:hypothetical protein
MVFPMSMLLLLVLVAVRNRQVTVEWQRQRAKEMRKYFQDKQLESAVQKSQ